MSEIQIPEYFHEAAEIFLRELEEHAARIQVIFEALKVSTEVSISSEASKELAERFHLIRGGAGFLGLEALRQLSTSSEKHFRDPSSLKEKQSAIVKLAADIPTIHQHIAELKKALGLMSPRPI